MIGNKIAGKLENTSAQNASETNTVLQTEDVWYIPPEKKAKKLLIELDKYNI